MSKDTPHTRDAPAYMTDLVESDYIEEFGTLCEAWRRGHAAGCADSAIRMAYALRALAAQMQAYAEYDSAIACGDPPPY